MGWRDWSCAPWQWGAIKMGGDLELAGYVMTGICRSVFATWIGVYGTLVLTGLGEAAQDCETKRVDLFFGWSPLTSSLVSIVLVAEGFVNAIFTPLMGAVADNTSYRTELFRAALLLLASTFVAIGILLFFEGEVYTLILVCILSIIGALVFELQTVLHAAYLPEMSPEEDRRLRISVRYHSIGSAMQLVFVGVALGANMVFGTVNDKVISGQVGVAVAFVMWSFWALPGMALLPARPKADEHKHRWGFCGTYAVAVNIKACYNKYHQIGLFLCAYSFYICGANALIGLATSYLVTELGIAGFDVQILIGMSLFFTVPGALLSGFLKRKFGSLKRLVLAVCVLWILIIVSIPVLLVGEVNPNPTPGEEVQCASEDAVAITNRPKGFSAIAVYIEAVFWGLGLGLIYPINWAFMAELVPGGREAGFFGLKTFAGKIFSWAPPLLFLAVNEATNNARLAITTLLPFLVIGTFILFFVDLDKAREQVADTLHLRHGYDAESGEPDAAPAKVVPSTEESDDDGDDGDAGEPHQL